MLAKAGEGDRHIRTKMVCAMFSHRSIPLVNFFVVVYSPSICLLENEKLERHKGDRCISPFLSFPVSFLYSGLFLVFSFLLLEKNTRSVLLSNQGTGKNK